MALHWETTTERLSCRWSEVGKRILYNPDWMREAGDIQGSYLPPTPIFTDHSPFGGASWFEWYSPSKNQR